jgi:hypothetical protein
LIHNVNYLPWSDPLAVPIEFQGVNAVGAGEYYDGIVPTCNSDDDLTKLFRDLEESSLNEALHYLTDGSCTIKKTLKTLIPRKEIRLHGFRREIGAF